jgi:hypothetical protein
LLILFWSDLGHKASKPEKLNVKVYIADLKKIMISLGNTRGGNGFCLVAKATTDKVQDVPCSVK